MQLAVRKILTWPCQIVFNECILYKKHKGVLFAQELQLPRVIFESDALAVIQAVNDKATGSFFGHLIQGILQNCESFESCHFKHLNRRFNLVAHELAQHARRTGIYQIWKGVAPSLCSVFSTFWSRQLMVFFVLLCRLSVWLFLFV